MNKKLLILTEGTILMHSEGKGLSREEIVKQVENNLPNVKEYANYIPIGNAQDKIREWQFQGYEIYYLTSRITPKEVSDIQIVLDKYNFPKGKLLYRKDSEEYKDIAERLIPDILIEDDCESIGGVDEMTYTHINNDLKPKIKSIPIKEFGGIDYLSKNL